MWEGRGQAEGVAEGRWRGAVPGMRKPRGAEERSGRRRAAPTRATAEGAKASEGAMADMATTAARNARENMLGSSVALDATTTLKAFVCALGHLGLYTVSLKLFFLNLFCDQNFKCIPQISKKIEISWVL